MSRIERGVNGASSATLNERFIKCTACKVNIPKDDMLALGKCTVCGKAYTPDAARTLQFTSGNSSTNNSDANSKGDATSKPKRKRWVVLVSKKGREYYHNVETGEDRWDKPAAIDADAAPDQFGAFGRIVLHVFSFF